jgi:two-component system sensor histidine kinase DesK
MGDAAVAVPVPPSTVLSSSRIAWLGRTADLVVGALALGPFAGVLAGDPPPLHVTLAAMGALVLAVLAIYHLRMVRGGRRVLPLAATLTPMFIASYGLMPLLGNPWLATPAFVLAAVLGALPWRSAVVVGLLIVLSEPAVAVLAGDGDGALYGTIQVTLSAAVLYGFARAVATTQDLMHLRQELATMAVIGERLRVSRDLHDLLGRSLAAIALKAELALRIQQTGAHDRVAQELEEIVELAHESGSDLRELVSGYRRMTLEQEVSASRDLLERRSVECIVDVDSLGALPSPVDQVLAWTLREAVTNVLRHSQATQCLVEGRLAEGQAVLSVRNDHGLAPHPTRALSSSSGSGTGLLSIAERVAALGGSSQARQQRDGWFVVTVSVPASGEVSDGSWGAA